MGKNTTLVLLGALGAGGVLSLVVYRLLTLQEDVSPEDEGGAVLPELVAPAQSTTLALVPVASQPSFQLRSDAASAFQLMEQAAHSAGVSLPISTAYRSRDYQQRLYDAWIAYRDGMGPPAPLAAKPGTSNHEKGIAIDFSGVDPQKANFSPARSEWLIANAASFNWYNSVRSEPWHYAFGVQREGVLSLG